MSKKILPKLLPVVTGGLFVALWYALHFFFSEERRFLLPTPAAVLLAFRDHHAALLGAALNTLQGAVIGLSSAVAVSFGLALLLSLSPLIRSSVYPYLMMLQMTPVIVLAPILILWAGPGLPSVSVITFLICFFPMVVNTTQGLISTDRHLVELFRMCRATRRQELLLLRVPAAMPYFFTGLRIAATLGPIGAIVGDFTAGNSGGDGGGLGFLSIIYSAQFKMPALFATALTGCLLGFCFVAVVVWLSWLALHKWHDSFAKTDT
jgi:NitT/TauT family transport system permease protein